MLDLVMHHAHGAWSRRWLAAGIAWAVGLMAVVYVYLLPNTFLASAAVHVDAEGMLRPLLKGLSVESDLMDNVAFMTQAIVSRPNLEAVARKVDLDIQSKTPEQFEKSLAALRSRISISQKQNNLFSIQYTDTDRATAVAVVRTLLNSFVEDTLGNKTEDSSQAEQTLRGQITQYEQRLVEAENRLKQFKQKNVGMMPDQQGDYYSRLQTVLNETGTLEQQLRIERQKLVAMERQLGGEAPVFGIMTPGGNQSGASSVDAKILELEQRLADLSIEYTEKHPEVVRTKSVLEGLRDKREAELAQSRALNGDQLPMVSSPLDLNPVYQSMKIQLSNTQLEIARLEASLDEKRDEVNRLQNLVDVIPEVEAELTRLNRDYNVVHARYQEMLERWESLQTSQHVRSGTDELQFRVVEPPFAALEAVGPPRALLLGAGSVFALGAGVAAALLMSFLNPVFLFGRELVSLGVPLIGTVTFKEAAGGEAASWYGSGRLAAFASCMIAFGFAVALATAYAGPASQVLRNLVT
jgi:polysaccharide chain length determinant protein (PEP-CTERM system associated)